MNTQKMDSRYHGVVSFLKKPWIKITDFVFELIKP